MRHEVITGLVYWRALELAERGHLSELTRLILRGDKFPAEYEQALAAYMSGTRRSCRPRDVKPTLDFMEAPVARMLFKALTSEKPKDVDKQVRRFVRAVTRESSKRVAYNGELTGDRQAAGAVELRGPQHARRSPDGPADSARMSKDEAIARMTIIFTCTEEAVYRSARLDKHEASRASPQHGTPRAPLLMNQASPISATPVADRTAERTL